MEESLVKGREFAPLCSQSTASFVGVHQSEKEEKATEFYSLKYVSFGVKNEKMSKRIGGGSGHDATPQAMINNDPSLFLFAPTQLSCAPAY